MERALQAITIMATFSIAHERVIEFVRWWINKVPSKTLSEVIDHATKGAWAWLPSIAIAVATNANVFDTFQVDAQNNAVFFAHYLSGPPHDGKAVLGCVIMGLAVTLGSGFWHDLSKGLMELRGKLQVEQPQPPPPTESPAK